MAFHWLNKIVRRQGQLSTERSRPRRRRVPAITIELLEDRTVPSTFTVTNVSDSGSGSLRQAISDANLADGGGSVITFAIPGSGVHTIQPISPLPTIIESVLINGYSQPGASPNTLTVGDNAVLQIQINGSEAGSGPNIDGIAITSSGSTIEGLDINGFSGYGVYISGSSANNNVVQGNFIGTDPTGMTAVANSRRGVYILNGASDNLVGTNGDGVNDPAERNLISGNGVDGLALGTNAQYNTVSGNYIGTDVSGTRALGNQQSGVGLFNAASYNTIGTTGANADQQNIISGNGYNGIYMENAGCVQNDFAGNYIGTDATGTLAVPNGADGIILTTDGVTGGPQQTVISDNVVSGNHGDGIHISYANNNTVVGNYIGTDETGTMTLPNTGNGIHIDNGSSGNTIGGTGSAIGNVISANGVYGVLVDASSNAVQDNDIGTGAGGNGTLLNTSGALEITSNGDAQVAGSFTGAVLDNGTLDLAGNDASIIGAFTGSGTVTNSVSASTPTLTLDGTGVFAGVIQDGEGSGTALTVAGGKVTLANANTYNGTTTIDGGATLQLARPRPGTAAVATLGSGGVDDNGTLDFELWSNTSVANDIFGDGYVMQGGIGIVTLTGDNGFFSGTITVNQSATLQAGSAFALSPNAAVDDLGSLNLNGYSSSIRALSGSGAVTNSVVTAYQIDNGVPGFGSGDTIDFFNNTLYSEAEDNWVGNVFTASAGGLQLNSITFLTGFANVNGAADPLNSTDLPSPYITAALYAGSPSSGLTLVPGSVNQVPLEATSYGTPLTVPFAAPQTLTAGETFTAVLFIDDVPLNVAPWVESDIGVNTNSYYDISEPPGNVNTYNLASPNGPTLNGVNYGNTGSTNAYVSTTILRAQADIDATASTLTVNNGGAFSGDISGSTTSLIVAGGTLTLSGANDYTGTTTVNAGTLLITGSVASAQVTVNSPGSLQFIIENTNDSGPGSLRQALSTTNNTTGVTPTINFASGLAGQTITLTSGQLNISASVNITGLGADVLAISANESSGVISITGGNVAISRLTITGGYLQAVPTGSGSSSGSGFGSSPSYYSPPGGGGIYNSASVLLIDCALTENTYNDPQNLNDALGGGLMNDVGGTATLVGCDITNNGADYGAGIYNLGTLTVANSTIAGNSANVYGAGIQAGDVTGNSLGGGNVSLVSDTIVDNNDYYNDSNFLPPGGGVSASAGTVVIADTLFAQNQGGDLASQDAGGTFYSTGFNLIDDTTATDESSYYQTGPGDLLNDAANIGPLGYYGGPMQTIPLLPGSPALGAGNGSLAIDPSTSNPLATDQRGFARVVNGAIDIGAFQTQANPLLVNTSDDSALAAGSGAEPAGELSLRDAVNLANVLTPSGSESTSTITFDPALSGKTIVVTGDTFEISGDVTITGPGAGSLSVSGNDQTEVFEIDIGAVATISNLSIIDGFDNLGGGISNSGYLTLADCIFSDNLAGGGDGGAIALDFSGATVIANYDTFEGNSAEDGGALVNYSGTFIVTGCTFDHNSANNDGGVLYDSGGSFAITDSTLTGNTATGSGGAVEDHGNLTITDSTIAANTAGTGGGIDNYFGSYSVILTNTIVAGNNTTPAGGYGPDIANQVISDGYNLIGNDANTDYPNPTAWQGTDLVGTPASPINPGLSALGYYGGQTATMALVPGSPAIGAGTVVNGIGTDQRGFALDSPNPDIGAFQSQQGAIQVTTTADSISGASAPGQVTLREAINLSNALASSTPADITFAIPTSDPGYNSATGVWTIVPVYIGGGASLPVITSPVLLDGWSQGGAGYTGSPLIVIDGSNASGDIGSFGFNIQASDTQVRGFAIDNFADVNGNGFGIGVFQPVDAPTINNIWIYGNDIGTDPTGMIAEPNGQGGIWVGAGPTNVLIGTDGTNDAAQRNNISGNDGDGILLQSSSTTVAGDYIGVAANGTTPLGNADNGIEVYGSYNTIGGLAGTPGTGAGNVISGNGNNGVLFFGDDDTVLGNLIGTDASGTVAMGNAYGGILIQGSYNTVGGTLAGARNVISATRLIGVNYVNDAGVSIWDAAYLTTAYNVVQGNYIGTDITGTVALGNVYSGVTVQASDPGSVGNLIGGSTPGAGNLISGNDIPNYGGAGIVVGFESHDVTIQGNRVGTNADGTAALPNSRGIFVYDAANVTIGGASSASGGQLAGAGNLISGNSSYGVELYVTTGGTLGLFGNWIGTDITGMSAIPNGNSGVYVTGNPNTTIGGTTAALRNIVSGNGGDGVELDGASSTLIEGNYVGVGADGVTRLGNDFDGILVSGSDNTIGGTAPGAGNFIGDNPGDGISVSQGAQNSIAQNTIFGNGGNGITVTGNGTLPDTISWWQANGNANDSVGGNNGTLQGGATFAAGLSGGQAFSLNGVNSYIDVPASPSLTPLDAVSVEAWINPATLPPANSPTGGWDVINELYDQGESSGPGAYALRLLSDGAVEFIIGTSNQGSGFYQTVTSGPGLVQPGTWALVAGTYDSSTDQLTIDVNGQATTTTATGTLNQDPHDLKIGADLYNFTYFDGLIAEPAVYSRALSAQEISGIYAADGASMGGTTIVGNTIGALSNGNPDGNAGDGIAIINSAANVIGGGGTVYANIIEASGQNGVLISGSGSIDNSVGGNRIGVSGYSGNAGYNAGDGVFIDNAGPGNSVGVGATNTLAFNGRFGVEIENSSATIVGDGNTSLGVTDTQPVAATVGLTANEVTLTDSMGTNVDVLYSGIAQLTIDTVGSQDYTSAVQLGTDTTLDSSDGGIYFNGQAEIGGDYSLTIRDAQDTQLNAAVGAATPLASLSIDSGGSTSLESVNTTGPITVASHNNVNLSGGPGIGYTLFSGGITAGGTVTVTSFNVSSFASNVVAGGLQVSGGAGVSFFSDVSVAGDISTQSNGNTNFDGTVAADELTVESLATTYFALSLALMGGADITSGQNTTFNSGSVNVGGQLEVTSDDDTTFSGEVSAATFLVSSEDVSHLTTDSLAGSVISLGGVIQNFTIGTLSGALVAQGGNIEDGTIGTLAPSGLLLATPSTGNPANTGQILNVTVDGVFYGSIPSGYLSGSTILPTVAGLSLSSSTIDENTATTLSGTIPGSASLGHTVVINWGDGTQFPDTTTLNLPAGVLSFSEPHVYLNNQPGNAPYTIQVTVTDSNGGNDPAILLGQDGFAQSYDLTSGNLLQTFTSETLQDATGLAMGPGNIVYASSFQSNEVEAFDPFTGQSLGVFASGGGLSGPEGLAFGPNGNLFVSSSNTGQILEYNGGTGAFVGVFASSNGATGPLDPQGLAFGPDGNLYVADGSTNGSVQEFNGSTGAYIGAFVPFDFDTTVQGVNLVGGPDHLEEATGLTFGPGGSLYVASFLNNSVMAFAGPEQSDPGSFEGLEVSNGQGGLQGPTGLAFDSHGLLDVAGETSGNVLDYADDSSGTVLSGLQSPASLLYLPQQTGTISVTVVNVPPTNAAVAVNPGDIPEGSSTTVTGSFTDTGVADTHTILLNWGDGTSDTVALPASNTLSIGQTITGSDGSTLTITNVDAFGDVTFTNPHRYLDEPTGQPTGSYTINFTVTDDDQASDSAMTSVEVDAVPPALTVTGPSQGVPTEQLSFTLSPVSPSPTDQAGTFTYEVNWGDGTQSSYTGPAGMTVTHGYHTIGSYSISATATDAGGETSAAADASVAITTTVDMGTTILVGDTEAAGTPTITVTASSSQVSVSLTDTAHPTSTPITYDVNSGTFQNIQVFAPSGYTVDTTQVTTYPVMLYDTAPDDHTYMAGSSGTTLFTLSEGTDNINLLGGENTLNFSDATAAVSFNAGQYGMQTLNSQGSLNLTGAGSFQTVVGSSTSGNNFTAALPTINSQGAVMTPGTTIVSNGKQDSVTGTLGTTAYLNAAGSSFSQNLTGASQLLAAAFGNTSGNSGGFGNTVTVTGGFDTVQVSVLTNVMLNSTNNTYDEALDSTTALALEAAFGNTSGNSGGFGNTSGNSGGFGNTVTVTGGFNTINTSVLTTVTLSSTNNTYNESLDSTSAAVLEAALNAFGNTGGNNGGFGNTLSTLGGFGNTVTVTGGFDDNSIQTSVLTNVNLGSTTGNTYVQELDPQAAALLEQAINQFGNTLGSSGGFGNTSGNLGGFGNTLSASGGFNTIQTSLLTTVNAGGNQNTFIQSLDPNSAAVLEQAVEMAFGNTSGNNGGFGNTGTNNGGFGNTLNNLGGFGNTINTTGGYNIFQTSLLTTVNAEGGNNLYLQSLDNNSLQVLQSAMASFGNTSGNNGGFGNTINNSGGFGNTLGSSGGFGNTITLGGGYNQIQTSLLTSATVNGGNNTYVQALDANSASLLDTAIASFGNTSGNSGGFGNSLNNLGGFGNTITVTGGYNTVVAGLLTNVNLTGGNNTYLQTLDNIPTSGGGSITDDAAQVLDDAIAGFGNTSGNNGGFGNSVSNSGGFGNTLNNTGGFGNTVTITGGYNEIETSLLTQVNVTGTDGNNLYYQTVDNNSAQVLEAALQSEASAFGNTGTNNGGFGNTGTNNGGFGNSIGNLGGFGNTVTLSGGYNDIETSILSNVSAAGGNNQYTQVLDNNSVQVLDQAISGFGNSLGNSGGFGNTGTNNGGFGNTGTNNGGFGNTVTVTGGYNTFQTSLLTNVTASGGYNTYTQSLDDNSLAVLNQVITAVQSFGNTSGNNGGFGNTATNLGGFGNTYTGSGGYNTAIAGPLTAVQLTGGYDTFEEQFDADSLSLATTVIADAGSQAGTAAANLGPQVFLGDGNEVIVGGLLGQFQAGSGADRFVIEDPSLLNAVGADANAALMQYGGSFSGGDGANTYYFVGQDLGHVQIDQSQTASIDTLDFSRFQDALGEGVTLNLGVTTGQQLTPDGSLWLTLSDGMGISNVVGTGYSDTIYGNGRYDTLEGQSPLDPRDANPTVPAPQTEQNQIVFLDFTTYTNPLTQHVYDTYEENAILAIDQSDYAPLGFVTFTLTQPTSGPYATVYINEPNSESEGGAGGLADQIDWRNLDLSDTASVNANGFIGDQSGEVPAGTPDTPSDTWITLTATIVAHETGHTLGLDHGDAYGPIGFGINSTPGNAAYMPSYPGPASAFETTMHIIASPASVGSTLADAAGHPFFGERESIKLEFSQDGTVIDNTANPLAVPNSSMSAAQTLPLVPMSVPNNATVGWDAGMEYQVGAIDVVDQISLDSTGHSQANWYSFSGQAGDDITLQTFSRALTRITDPVDTVLTVYDSQGNIVGYYGGTATNFDDPLTADAVIDDLILPATGTYYVEVSALQGIPQGQPGYNPAEANDTETGTYELLIYRASEGNPINPSSQDTLVPGAGGATVIGVDPSNPMVNPQALPVQANQSVGTGMVPVASFTDPGSAPVAGNYSAMVNWGDNSSSPGTISVNGDVVTVLAQHTYSQSGTFTFTVSVDQVSAQASVALEGQANVAAINYAVTTSVTSSESTATYGDSLTFTADVSPQFTGESTPTGAIQFVIDGSDFGSPVSLVNGQATSAAISTLSAGTHTVTALFEGTGIFQAATSGTGATASLSGGLLVNKASLTVTASNESKVYGDVDPTLTYTSSGTLFNGDTYSVIGGVVLSTTTGAAATAGAHTILISGGTAANYSVTFMDGTLTVSPASLAVTANNQSKVYGAVDPTLTFTPSGTLYYSDTYSVISGVLLNTVTGAAAAAGTHTIYASGAMAANYTIIDANGTLTVAKAAALTATANNQSKTYGGADPTLTYTVTGTTYYGDVAQQVVSGVALSTVTGSAATAGTHTITASGGTAANYNVNDVNGTLTVAQAPLTVATNPQSKVYGQTFTAFTGTVTGIQYSDPITVSYSSTGSAASAIVGSYPVTATPSDGGTGALANYSVTNPGSTLTVNKDATTTTVTASTASASYGQGVTFTANVAANAPGSGTPTGAVDFYDSSTSTDLGTVSLASGKATLTESTLSVGSHTITVSYEGDSNFLTSTTSTGASVTVNAGVLVLNPTAAGALTASGSASINAPGSIIVDSSSSSAVTASGTASINGSAIQIVGKYSLSGSAKFGTTPKTGAASVADPLINLAEPSTTGVTNYGSYSLSGSSTGTIKPGIYTQIQVSGSATLTMQPGVYIIEGGGFSVSGSAIVTGQNVTIFNAGSTYPTTGGTYGNITLSGSGAITLTAPSTGTYAGISIFQARDNAKTLTISGSGAAGVTGTIYAPDAALTESGSATLKDSLIVNTLSLSGSSVFNQAQAGYQGTVYTPAQIQGAYGVSSLALDGTGQTIAIVDAYDDPAIFQSLDTFDSQFGATSTGPTLLQQYGPASSFLTVVDQNGGANLPATDPAGAGDTNWEMEEALDVEWAHAMAPGAQIVLVESNSDSLSDLMTGVVTAANQPGVSVVSMSWGFPEGQAVFAADEAQYDGDFTTPAGHQGVTFVASTGDYGSADPEYPAFSPNVLSVGGTSLTLNADNSYNSETAWGYYSQSQGTFIGSGGGASLYEPEPGYQAAVQSTGNRTTPDVALVADPATGAWMADAYNSPAQPWVVVGGTSLSAPSWAGLVADVNEGRAAAGESTFNTSSPTQIQEALYTQPQGDFNVVGTAGYNTVTGLGTPIANLLVPGLVSYQGGGSAPTAPPSGSGTGQSGSGSTNVLATMNVFDALVVKPGEFGGNSDTVHDSDLASLPTHDSLFGPSARDAVTAAALSLCANQLNIGLAPVVETTIGQIRPLAGTAAAVATTSRTSSVSKSHQDAGDVLFGVGQPEASGLRQDDHGIAGAPMIGEQFNAAAWTHQVALYVDESKRDGAAVQVEELSTFDFATPADRAAMLAAVAAALGGFALTDDEEARLAEELRRRRNRRPIS